MALGHGNYGFWSHKLGTIALLSLREDQYLVWVCPPPRNLTMFQIAMDLVVGVDGYINYSEHYGSKIHIT